MKAQERINELQRRLTSTEDRCKELSRRAIQAKKNAENFPMRTSWLWPPRVRRWLQTNVIDVLEGGGQ